MKFSMDTQKLKNIAGTLARVVTRDISETGSSGIGIEVSSDSVFFKTQQFDFNVVYRIEVGESSEGKVFVPIQILDGAVSYTHLTLPTKA